MLKVYTVDTFLFKMDRSSEIISLSPGLGIFCSMVFWNLHLLNVHLWVGFPHQSPGWHPVCLASELAPGCFSWEGTDQG